MSRPLKFQSVEELQEKIDEYFELCDNRTTVALTKQGKLIEVPDPRPYTVSGLALYLDTTRQGLINYENRDEFYDTIRRAKSKIEAFAEESLWTPKVATGVIFNLKNNFGWVDKSEVDSNVNMKYGIKLPGDLDDTD
jgi:hypothetical protein